MRIERKIFTYKKSKHKMDLEFRVYKQQRSMIRAVNRLPGRKLKSSTQAACVGWSKEANTINVVLFFHEGNVTAGNVAHEAFHSVIEAAKVWGFNVHNFRNNEKLALFIDSIVNSFWNWWFEEEDEG